LQCDVSPSLYGSTLVKSKNFKVDRHRTVRVPSQLLFFIELRMLDIEIHDGSSGAPSFIIENPRMKLSAFIKERLGDC
jgi:hypothetical protein